MYLDIDVDSLKNTNYLNLNETSIYVHKNDLINIPSLARFLTLESFLNSDKIDISNHHNKIQIIHTIMFDKKVLIEKNKVLYFDFFKLLPIYQNIFTANQIFSDYSKQHELIYGLEVISLDKFTDTELDILYKAFMNNVNRLEIHREIYIEPTKFLKDISYDVHSFTKIKDVRQFVLTQFKIYLSTQLGSIPFNNEFGSIIKKLLQKKSTQDVFDLIEDEIRSFVAGLNSVYKSDETFSVKVDKIQIEENTRGFSIVVNVYVFLIINEEPFNFSFDFTTKRTE